MGLLYKVYLGFIGLIMVGMIVFFVTTPLENQDTDKNENTCMELMDMDFQTEQECIEFIQSLFGEIEDKLDDPKVQELLKNYNP